MHETKRDKADYQPANETEQTPGFTNQDPERANAPRPPLPSGSDRHAPTRRETEQTPGLTTQVRNGTRCLSMGPKHRSCPRARQRPGTGGRVPPRHVAKNGTQMTTKQRLGDLPDSCHSKRDYVCGMCETCSPSRVTLANVERFAQGAQLAKWRRRFEDQATHQPRMRPRGSDSTYFRGVVVVAIWCVLLVLAAYCLFTATSCRSDRFCQSQREGQAMRIYQAPSGRWGIDYAAPSGGRVRKVIGTRNAARAALSRVQVAVLDGSYGRLAARQRVTVERVAELWRVERGHKAGWPAVRGHLARAVDHFGGQLDVMRLGRAEVAAWRRSLAEAGLAASTRNRHVASLRAALSLAMDHDLIEANPLRRTKM
jgi:hypothetical protein